MVCGYYPMFDPVIQNGGNMPLRHADLLGLLYAAYICNVKILPYGNKETRMVT